MVFTKRAFNADKTDQLYLCFTEDSVMLSPTPIDGRLNRVFEPATARSLFNMLKRDIA